MSEFAKWLLGLVKALLEPLWNWVTDLFIAIAEMVLTGLAGLIKAIPAPAFLSSNGLSSAFAQIPPEVWYFATHFKFGACLAVLAAAVAFRLTRKLVTLGQW